MPPRVPSNPVCRAPAAAVVECGGETGLAGRLDIQRRLGLFLLFGFEVDTLEIALRESLDLVDWVFLVESTKTHKGVRH